MIESVTADARDVCRTAINHELDSVGRALVELGGRTVIGNQEIILWQCLRGKQLGYKFRRQVPMGPYIVDFLCFSKKLAIEVDGMHHELKQTYDLKRTKWLELNGFTVMRFWNEEVLHSLESVLGRIIKSLSCH